MRDEFAFIQIITPDHSGNKNFIFDVIVAQSVNWVFVLIENIELVTEYLNYLLRVGESNAKIVIVGSMTYHHDAPSTIQSATGIFGPFWEPIHRTIDVPEEG